MNYLIGTYECKIDVKGRVLIPSSLKKQMSSVLSKGFVLKRAVFQNCLELYPINEWEELIKRVNSLNRFKKKNNDFIRRFTAGVKFIEVDNNNRILIPKDLIEFSNIKRDIVFSSSVNIIEIWDKDKYENAIVDSREDFAKLAEEVMGDDNE
ncbi:division/cell wall cluster transcriptional repressor MraZ [bacterium]|nr:division/cell wall cluster transcriptional repressor MraZ [bacterium]